MRKLVIFSILAAIVVLAAPAWAGLAGSQHNLVGVYGLTDSTAKQGMCSFCHIPHGASASAGLFPAQAATMPGTSDFTSNVALVCYNCHWSGTSYGSAANPELWDGDAHDSDLSNIAGLDIATVDSLDGAVYAIDTAADTIDCLSCHEPHNGDVRPFMRDNPGSVDLTEGDLNTLCNDCHLARYDNAGVDLRTNHPATGDVAVSAATPTADTEINAAISGTAMTNAWASTANQFFPGAGSWNLGGKTVKGSATQFNCATCHAVHFNETTAWGSADGDLVQIDFDPVTDLPGNNLVVMEGDPTTGIAGICASCHVNDATAGPGVTGSKSHPVGDLAAAWSIIPGGSGNFGTKGLPDVLGCQSCHDMHFSAVNGYDNVGAGQANYVMLLNECKDCHADDTVSAFFQTNHHPAGIELTGTDVDFDAAGEIWVSSNVDWSATGDAARTLVNTDTKDSDAANTLQYDIPDGLSGNPYMSCATCHSGATAHNNAIAGGWPGLAGAVDESQMCVDCHGKNPSDNTANASTYAGAGVAQGSHYLGGILAITQPAAAFVFTSTTTHTLKWSTDPAADDAVICESCHTLKLYEADGFTADNPLHSDNDGDAAYVSTDVGLLLGPAGNNDNSASANNLCTGCHGVTPGAGAGGSATHPLVWIDGAASATIQGYAGDGVRVNEDVSLNSALGVTCESCHRPHDAAGDGGTLILELADGTGFLDESLLCSACHGDK